MPPRPIPPSNIGMAQQDAAPKAVAIPPATNAIGPIARIDARCAGRADSDFTSSDIACSWDSQREDATLYSRYRLKARFSRGRHGSTVANHHRRAVAAHRLQGRNRALLRARWIDAAGAADGWPIPALRRQRRAPAGVRAPRPRARFHAHER